MECETWIYTAVCRVSYLNGVTRGGSFTHYGYGAREHRNSGFRRQLPRGTEYYVVGFR